MILKRTGVFFFIPALFCLGMLTNLGDKSSDTDAKAQVLMRKIGHELLLQAGDLTSRVLPVEKLNTHTFQLNFENPFTFETDSLAKTVESILSKSNLSQQYLIQVLECQSQQIMYTFEIQPAKENDIPCLGRKQPKACYSIIISLEEKGGFVQVAKAYFNLGSLFLILGGIFIGYWAFRGNTKTKAALITSQEEEKTEAHTIGKYNFCFEKQILKSDNQTIPLTYKEAKLLNFFASSPNQILDRDFLLKKVWEDEGVFVSRSLDVFISRLRKRLQDDSSIRIVNIHGKGYKLETDK